jgi:hypothetical protein
MKSLTLFTSLAVLGFLPWSASATTYSDTDFNAMGSYNGTYVSGSPGYEQLSYVSTDDPNDAVVGVKGPLGTLSSLNMSFVFSTPSGTGTAPFAAFGISDNSTWVAGPDRLNVISMNGNQLIGTSLVHVWDWNLNADVAGYGQSDNRTLNSILATYGTWEVMRAYAYIGDTGEPSSGSVDINSITVTSSVPDGISTLPLLGLGLGSLLILGYRRNRLAMAK